jgi:hypothetical protein
VDKKVGAYTDTVRAALRYIKCMLEKESSFSAKCILHSGGNAESVGVIVHVFTTG